MLALLVPAMLLLTACGPDTKLPPAKPTAFSSIQTNIFDASCLGACHIGSSAPAGLRLDSGNSQIYIFLDSQQVTARKRIKPFDPVNSYLLMKVRGDAGIMGATMPLNGAPLSAARIKELEDWVAAGADPTK